MGLGSAIGKKAGMPTPRSSLWSTSSVSGSGAGRADRPLAAIARGPGRCERQGCVRARLDGPPCSCSRRRGVRSSDLPEKPLMKPCVNVRMDEERLVFDAEKH